MYETAAGDSGCVLGFSCAARKAQASRFGTKTQLAGRTLTPMPPVGGERSAVRKNQYNLHIRLDEDERAALEKGLQASGLPLSAYLRKLILGERIQAAPSEELRRLRTEIHQIGNNINQLARKANAGFASRDEVTRALRMLDRVYELMYEFSK